MTGVLKIVGGSKDGVVIPATRGGRPPDFVYSGSTGEVWLRDGDRLVLAPDATFEDGVTYFEGEPS